MTTYATVQQLRDNISPTYAAKPEIADDDDALMLLVEASKVVDEATLSAAQVAYDSEELELETPLRDALALAVVKQVEFWLEVGPEHDVATLTGSMVAGRVQVHPVAPVLGRRARRELRNAGLIWSGVAIG